MTERLGRTPLLSDMATMPEAVVAELERYYGVTDGPPIRVG